MFCVFQSNDFYDFPLPVSFVDCAGNSNFFPINRRFSQQQKKNSCEIKKIFSQLFLLIDVNSWKNYKFFFTFSSLPDSGRRRHQVKHEKHRRRSRTRSQSRQKSERLTTSCCRFNSPTIPFVLILLVCAICDVTGKERIKIYLENRFPCCIHMSSINSS